jgi:hypothetical protein
MSTINGGWVRGLASAGAVLAVLGAAPTPASAADLGGSCCADLEERVAELEATAVRKGQREKVELKISGVVGRALLYWDDGTEQNTYVVDNAKDATTFTFEGEAEIAKGWRAGFLIGVDSLTAESNKVDQFTDNAGSFFDLADAYFFLANERLGTVRVGQNDSASDKVDNLSLAGADVLADNAPEDWNAGFFLSAANGQLLTDVRWEDFSVPVAGTNANIVTYVSPEVSGFQASASWGQDDFWDAALRYQGEWANVLEVHAAIGYHENTTEGNTNTIDPVTGLPIVNPTLEDSHWGAGIAVRHKPTGLNLAVNYSTEEHTDKCVDRGRVSRACRGDDEFVYVVGGIIRDLNSLGPTAFYAEYYNGTRQRNDSDRAVLNALLLNPGQFDIDPDNPDPPGPGRRPKAEFDESDVTVWGFGVVQKINDASKPAGKKDKAAAKEAAAGEPIMELYVGYKHFELDVDLVGLHPTTHARMNVPAKKLNDFDAVMTGAIIRF